MAGAGKRKGEVIAAGDREVTITSPDKVLFPDAGYTKLDVARYYLAVAGGALRGAGGRPNMLVRFPNGIAEENFYQKRAPKSRPDWIEVVTLRFPSGRSADEVVPRDAAALLWLANLGCLELHPHPVRAEDLDHPDELRVDLDPVPGVEWPQVQAVAAVVRETLHDYGLIGWPKTSGSRGMHINVRIRQSWTFDEVRRAALALAREVERRAPRLATSKWWKEERHGVFVDYNQNAKDRTVASAYSIRPKPDARVSTPLAWDEVDSCDPADFTIVTVPQRFARIGDPHARIDDEPGSLDALLELSAEQERAGHADAPWPPHYRRQENEPPRVQPSKRRTPGARRSSTNKAAPDARAQSSEIAAPGATARSSAGRAPGAGPKRRTPKHPLIEIGRAQKKEDALAGLERWKDRHPDAAKHLQPADILTDAMRGRYNTWTRIRINLQHVPEELRPPQEPLDPDAAPDYGPPQEPLDPDAAPDYGPP